MVWLGFGLLAATGCFSPIENIDDDDEETGEPEDTAVVDTDTNDTTDTQDTEPEDTEPDVIIPNFDGDLSTVHTTIKSNSSGIATAYVEVPSGGESFLLTAASTTYGVAVERVRAPSGTTVVDWQSWQGDEKLTNAFYVSSTNTFNYPMLTSDGALATGIYEVDYAVVTSDNFYASNATVDLTVQIKEDDDLSTGTLHVEVFLTDPVANNAGYTQAVYDAVDVWNDIWNDKGLAVEATFWTAGLGGTMYRPGGAGGATYASLSASGADDNITLVVAESIENTNTLLGIAGGIPGQLTAGEEAVFLVDCLNNAGSDGVYDADDIAQLGETMAHEAGHYMGLYHPVELTWDNYDAHSDTSNCVSENNCATQLGSNLMFPTPVCGSFGCIQQDQLSAQQKRSLHLYTGTL